MLHVFFICYTKITSLGYVTFRSKRSKGDRNMFISRRPDEWIYTFNYYRRQQMNKQGLYVLAPFWADTNFFWGKESKVYYQIYRRNKAMKKKKRPEFV